MAITVTGSDVDGDLLTYSIVDAPTHGALTGTAPSFTYTPLPNYLGPDSFMFRAFDGTAFSASALVALSVDSASLPCGAFISGAIGAAAEVDSFVFSGQAGQIVTLALASTGGFSANPGSNVSATLTLFGPSGTAVGTLRSNSLNNFALPAAGTYVLRVSATKLATAGSYTVRLVCPS